MVAQIIQMSIAGMVSRNAIPDNETEFINSLYKDCCGLMENLLGKDKIKFIANIMELIAEYSYSYK